MQMIKAMLLIFVCLVVFEKAFADDPPPPSLELSKAMGLCKLRSSKLPPDQAKKLRDLKTAAGCK